MGIFYDQLIPVLNGFAYGLLLFTVAAGLTLAFGVAGVLNLAHGTFYVAGGYVAVMMTNGTWVSLIAAIVVAAVVGAVAGGLLSVAIAPLAKRSHLTQALFTFGISLVGGAGLIAMFGPSDMRPDLPAVLTQSVSVFGRSYPGYRLTFVVVAIVLVIIGWFVVSKTQMGARVRATVDDSDMVAGIGTSPRVVMTGVLVVAGTLAGLAGALGAPIIGPNPTTAQHVLLLSLIIVVLGRLGSVTGAFVAAIFVGQVQSFGFVMFKDIAPYLLFGAMALVLLIRKPEAMGLGEVR